MMSGLISGHSPLFCIKMKRSSRNSFLSGSLSSSYSCNPNPPRKKHNEKFRLMQEVSHQRYTTISMTPDVTHRPLLLYSLGIRQNDPP